MPELFQSLDGALLLAIQQLRLDVLNPLVVLYTHLGDAGMVWILLSLALLLYKPTRKVGAAALLALAFGFLCTNVVLKNLVGRERPWLHLAQLIPLVEEHDPASFPSGHTTAAFAAGMVWARHLPRRGARMAAVAAAVCMGLSRLYVGVHYPSDVLAGAFIGFLCSLAAEYVVQWIQGRTKTA